MNRDSEDIQRRILMLLRDFPSTASTSDEVVVTQSRHTAIAPSLKQPTLLSPQLMNSSTPDPSESNYSFSKELFLELGDVPVVQERFEALLKHRLQAEIQRKPPLFPWETEMVDYDAEVESIPTPVAAPRSVAPQWGWLRQVQNLKLPVPAQIPEPVLATLLQRCQDVVQSSLQDGAKLVRAVEALFPGQDEALNYLAGNVVTMAPARSPEAAIAEPPIDYETAAPAQQMLLSLLAAREIIGTLLLTVSAQQPTLERQWQTDAGVVSLHLQYCQSPTASVRVQAELPTGGSVTVRGDDLQTTTQRKTAGRLSAELPDPQPNHAYTVEIHLAGVAEPLIFTLRLIPA